MTAEGALHLDDVLTRRTRVSIETAHRGVESAPEVAALMAGALGWDDERTAREVEHYAARVAAERESQRMPDDRTADAARLGAPDVRARGLTSRTALSGWTLGAAAVPPRNRPAPVTSRPMWQLRTRRPVLPLGQSRTVIPELLGEPVPADRPHAELWIGAHPDEPSALLDGRAAGQGASTPSPRPCSAAPVRRALRRPAAVPDEGAGRRHARCRCRRTPPPSRPRPGSPRRRRPGSRTTTRPARSRTRSTSPSCCSR